MHYKNIKSPIGKITLVSSEDALVALYVNDELMPKKDLAKKSDTHTILFLAEKQLNEYFEGRRKTFDIPLHPEGTEFQNKAWKVLSSIPYGNVWSYGQQAKTLNSPNGQRAVGGANGKNPIPIIIPCHRVIGSTGKLTGFSGGMNIKVFLLKLEGHLIDEDALNTCVNEHTKLIVITSPNNPTGVVLNKKSLDAVKKIALKNDVFILSDDVYQQLVYTDNFYKLSDDPSIRHLLIVAQSFSKPYAMTGWRIGYLMADQAIATHINSMHSYLVTGITSFIQIAAIEALNQDTSEMSRIYFNRLVKCKKILDSKKIKYVNPEGAFYLFVNIEAFGLKSEDLCLKPLNKYRVALVPGIYFSEFTDDYIRISYAVKEDDLYEGINRLSEMIQDLRQC